MTDNIAGVEIAGLEIDGLEIDGLEFGGLEFDELQNKNQMLQTSGRAMTRSHERRQVQLKTVANTSRANHRSRYGYLSRSERR